MSLSQGAPGLHPFLEAIAANARERPDVPALMCEDQTFSYVDFWRGAVTVSERLLAAGLTPGDRVAFDAERLPQTYMNLLGVLIAGAIYVPLGEKAPPARHDAILADSGARFRLNGEAMTPCDGQASNGTEPAGYILYTSGSTGVPKGVQITLDNLLDYFENVEALYPVQPGERVAQLLDLSFDVAGGEMFQAWRAGATLCVIPSPHILMWPRYFRYYEISEAKLVPSQVRLAADSGMLKPGSLPKLRQVILGGELVTGSVVRYLREAAPDVNVINFFGPTEATIYISHYPVTKDFADHEGVPIGMPLSGQTLLIDDTGDGTGELLLGGSQLARGYWRLPEINTQRFIERDGERFYRTGDMARFDPEHGFVFLARLDRQVKLKGYRIELDETEKIIRKHAGIDLAYVIVDGDTLVCAIQAEIDLARVEAAVREELPSYSVPSRFVVFEAFPFTPSGKIDYKRIREIVTA